MKKTMVKETIERLQLRLEHCLEGYLKDYAGPAICLNQAMSYSSLSGGKRLRPLLVYLCGIALQVPLEQLDASAAAIELIHCYSLIHDDLPAMDDDDLRRGQASCHRAFDEATAILAGDALQSLAFQIIAEAKPQILKAEQKVRLIACLASASGMQGMVAGQSLDLSALSTRQVSPEELAKIHKLKTGRLLEAAIELAIHSCANIGDAENAGLRQFSRHFGLAFQMQDDFLDCYGDTTSLGKPQGSDHEQGKCTYASLYSQQALLSLIEHHYQSAKESLAPLGQRGRDLQALSDIILKRCH